MIPLDPPLAVELPPKEKFGVLVLNENPPATTEKFFM